MAEGQSQNGRAAASLANRLRIIQEQMADRPIREREAHLADEIRRHVGSMLPDDRAAFLEQLEGYFPPWGDVPEERDAGLPTADQWNSPQFVARQLSRLAEREGKKEEVQKALREVGLQAEATVAGGRALGQWLGLGQADSVEIARVAEALVALGMHLVDEERYLGEVGRVYGGPAAGQGRLVDAITRYISSPAQDPARKQKKQALDAELSALKLRLRALLSAVPRLMRQHAEKFAPAEIEALVSGFGKEAKAWKKYGELCGGADREYLENELKQTYAEAVREVGRGMKLAVGEA